MESFTNASDFHRSLSGARNAHSKKLYVWLIFRGAPASTPSLAKVWCHSLTADWPRGRSTVKAEQCLMRMEQ